MPTSMPIPVTPATRMRIATMYTGAGAIDYGCVRVYDDDDDGDDATLCERGKKRNLLFARDDDDSRVCTPRATGASRRGFTWTYPRESSFWYS